MILVHKTYNADLITPVAGLLKLQHLSDYHILLESVTGGEVKGRYSVIAMLPQKLWKVEKNIAYTSSNLGKTYKKIAEGGKNVFESFRKFQQSLDCKIPDFLPSIACGIFGFMGYDMVRLMEDLPNHHHSELDIPDAVYFQPKIIIIFDNITDKIHICSPVKDDEKSHEKGNKLIDKVYAALLRNKISQNFKYVVGGNSNLSIPSHVYGGRLGGGGSAGELKAQKLRNLENDDNSLQFSSFKEHVSRAEYDVMVQKAREYIKAGDIFQVVPSRRFSAPFNLPETSFYRSLRSLNPSPYLFYAKLGSFVICGSSPEIMVRLKNNIVTVRPIAGTRKRGANEAEDLALEKDLLADQKEISEHLMLLDLGRNDVGRVAKAGTVNVTQKMAVERYSHVMHIVSNVEGEISSDKDFLDALIAGFPAGTVSGAPKIRAMEIIEELEKEKRKFYAGTVGYVSSNGDMDTCIALRTALIKDGMIYLQAGGGVVHDSTEEGEFLETQNKAAALMKAAENAKNYL